MDLALLSHHHQISLVTGTPPAELETSGSISILPVVGELTETPLIFLTLRTMRVGGLGIPKPPENMFTRPLSRIHSQDGGVPGGVPCNRCASDKSLKTNREWYIYYTLYIIYYILYIIYYILGHKQQPGRTHLG